LREFTGKYCFLGDLLAIWPPIVMQFQAHSGKFPTQINRETIQMIREFKMYNWLFYRRMEFLVGTPVCKKQLSRNTSRLDNVNTHAQMQQ